MNKISISIDVLKIVGASRVTSQSGKDCIVIDIKNSRIKLHTSKKDGSVAAYLDLDVIEKVDGPDQFEKTHFIGQPVTREEREQGVKLPILGNGREYRDQGTGQNNYRSQAPQQRETREYQRPQAGQQTQQRAYEQPAQTRQECDNADFIPF